MLEERCDFPPVEIDLMIITQVHTDVNLADRVLLSIPCSINSKFLCHFLLQDANTDSAGQAMASLIIHYQQLRLI